MKSIEKRAFELYCKIHRKLGHEIMCTWKEFHNIPGRKEAWIEIARTVEKEHGIYDAFVRFVAGLPSTCFSLKDQRELKDRLSEIYCLKYGNLE